MPDRTPPPEIRSAFRAYQGPDDDPSAPDDGWAAAVALILRDREFLLIRRAHLQGDPWSGQMALPGGRRDPGDDSLLRTAIRETREEVDINLGEDGRLLGCLSVLAPRSRELPAVSILPFVFSLTRPATPNPRRTEVAEALWVPLSILHRPDARSVHHHPVAGARITFPALDVDGRTVWGLTHRILEDFRRRLDESAGRGGDAPSSPLSPHDPSEEEGA